MRHRSDDNQAYIIDQLRQRGISVAVLSHVGNGVPDVLAGWKGVNYLLEIKDGNKVPSKRKLTPAQKKFHASWKGQKAVVENIEQALEVITKNKLT